MLIAIFAFVTNNHIPYIIKYEFLPIIICFYYKIFSHNTIRVCLSSTDVCKNITGTLKIPVMLKYLFNYSLYSDILLCKELLILLNVFLIFFL